MLIRYVGLLGVLSSAACGSRMLMGTQDGGSLEDGAGGGGGGGIDGAAACTGGTVTFRLSAAGGKSANYCILGCPGDWVAVRALGGESMPLDRGCTTTCDVCRSIACERLCPAPKPMPPDGETLTWDGTYWPSGTCGDRQPCRDRRCAVPGRYVVRMCAATSNSDAGFCLLDDTRKCVELEFDYPSATVIEGVL